jgi:DNA-binding NtrC family response regulator
MAAVLTMPPPVLDCVDSECGSGKRVLEPRSRILSISGNDADHTALRRLVRGRSWQFRTAFTCGEAIRELWCGGARVVFCEMTLPDGEWKDVIGRIADLRHPPRFAVVSKRADEGLWFDVLNLGGYDVLSKPLVEDEVRNVLGAAPAAATHPIRRPQLFLVRRR